MPGDDPMWDEIGRERYGVDRRRSCAASATACRSTASASPRLQPENNVIRIVLEALGVTLSKKARCRLASSFPAWNEALGLPRPWDQQWSLRIQQILAYETDLLEYADLFDGSHVVEAETRRTHREAARPSSIGCWRWVAQWPPSRTPT